MFILEEWSRDLLLTAQWEQMLKLTLSMVYCSQNLLLMGEVLAATSYADLLASISAYSLKLITLSLLFKVALICSSVWTKRSSSMLRSLFWFWRTAQC